MLLDACETDSRSMQRYGRELRAALATALESEWKVNHFSAVPGRVAGALKQGVSARAVTAVMRYVQYPLNASRLKADVFHVLDHAYAHLLLALDPRRTVVTCHDLIPLLVHRRMLDLAMDTHVGWTFQFRMRFMRRAAYIIAVSESTRRDIINLLGVDPERVVTVPNGVAPVFHPSPDQLTSMRLRKQLQLPLDLKLVLNVSGTNEYKNIGLILRAIGILKQRRTNIRFLRAGGDFSAGERKLIRELGISDCVQYVGSPAGDSELADLYRLADVFAFPSFYEGFGWPPLEAMRCGTPVVASNAGSLPEVLGDAALLIEPHDARGVADALAALMSNQSLRAERVTRGLQRASTYTWERTAQQTGEVYQRIARDRRSPAL